MADVDCQTIQPKTTQNRVPGLIPSVFLRGESWPGRHTGREKPTRPRAEQARPKRPVDTG
jgi:hypothetical protein